MLAQIRQTLQRGEVQHPPAYTLILGAGASFGVVPTAKELLGLPDKSGSLHANCIPFWLARQAGRSGTDPAETSNAEKQKFVRQFWSNFLDANPDLKAARADRDQRLKIELKDGLPGLDSIADAYKSLFDQRRVGGLNSPAEARGFLRDVTLSRKGPMQLNATHFYLASLLSLQSRAGNVGVNNKLLYDARRPFARTLFTTNFDPLLQTSLGLFHLLYYMTDRPESLAADALQTDEHPAVHLFYAHGSVHRPYLANTQDEISLLKNRNARDIAAYLGTHGVIVLGYSGWDDCLLDALNQSSSFANNLYWLARGEESLSEPVRKFLRSHANAFWVVIEDGGKFMADLHALLCPGAPNTELLHNPMRPLREQIEAIRLFDIATGSARPEATAIAAGEQTERSNTDLPEQAEPLRKQVVEYLLAMESKFKAPQTRDGGLEELERQADLHYSNRDWEAALVAYDALLNRADWKVSSKATAYFRRGYCYGIKREIEKAIADYSVVIKLPDAPVEQVAKALVNRGLLYRHMGENDEALADFSQVFNLPNAPVEQVASALVNRGILCGQQGENDKALADFSEVFKLPNVHGEQLASALYNRGVCHGYKSENDKALADFSEVIKLPDAPVDLVAGALANRGVCYRQKGENDKALADYSELIKLPGAPVGQVVRALANRGALYGQKGENDKAEADYAAAKALGEDSLRL